MELRNAMEDHHVKIVWMSVKKTILVSNGTVLDFVKLQKDLIDRKESRWTDQGFANIPFLNKNLFSILMFDSEEPKRISSIEIEFESTPGKASYGLLHIAKTVVLSVDERRLRLDLSLHGTDTAGMVVRQNFKQ